MRMKELFVLLGIAISFQSCTNTQIKSNSSIEGNPFIRIASDWDDLKNYNHNKILEIEDYKSKYNPKANGYIWILLEDSSVYEATSIDGGSFASVMSLINDPNVRFDTVRKEFVIQKLLPDDTTTIPILP